MHCVSAYPCDDDRINLNRINWLKGLNKRVGFSDHSQSTVVPALAIPLGIEVIEKHFTTDHNLPGRDNKFALLPNDFKNLSINKDHEILSICKSGERSQFVAGLLEKENYKSANISDGFDGWLSCDLPSLKEI